ncbi:hypothetical protein BE1S18E01_P10900 (plasmid) [Acinetobacter sp. BEC1-S18-ESBL-01]|jgi:TRAP-type mannitol/chloroaromatic compound transport system permease small subunit|uniref:Uncharacterized protein n=2 Tax=Acinetobacter TaxID=469 RepID=A0A6S4URP2_ACIPI|nr:hypothetical protein F970_02147 [Acinetobacter sp. CIP 102082]EXE24329.1 hypothetical protein J569_3736 [Acinetobacter sp. 907131]EXH25165.1 hypothetical protein J623_3632 [Acinetobacter sp. 1245249]SSV76201.1 Uncharacterised protein [Acinetobacter nosocomialis]VXA57240.1 conserved hypothetical protein [Acinetobacter proteolyticus]BBQ50901.1 hypothetical protein WP2W18E11_P10900 [Acinetobacter pittii]BBU20182.1 hypothetical protein BE1S18E01_P10900 [Acinetobacter sp. BEC1-S18-ESBL-01]
MLHIKITIYKNEIKKHLPALMSLLGTLIFMAAFFALSVHFNAAIVKCH